MYLSSLDLVVVSTYVLTLILIGWLSVLGRPDTQQDTRHYFLASRKLRWWNVGASLVAVNITAAVVISMSGSGFAVGLGIASYEWLGAVTLLFIGKYFLPVLLQSNVQTLPQFLALRYNRTLSMLISIVWIIVYILIGLTTLLWLAASVIEMLIGIDQLWAMLLLGLIALAYSLRGGLTAIAVVDVVQLLMLVLGGILLSWVSLDAVAAGKGAIAGFSILTKQVPGHFDLILDKDNASWKYLPGLAVFGIGMWIMQIAYLGFNQYIIQRAMAAKSLREAQAGTLFAAWLKLLMPVLVVLPGIAAWALYPDLAHADQAYPAMIGLAPSGLRGLIFAALIGATVSALGSLLNSIATLFTLNLYKPFFPTTSETRLVQIGSVCIVVSLLLSLLLARPLLGETEQVYQYIQNFVSYLSPGVAALFLLAMYWSRTRTIGAILALIASPLLTVLYQVLWPAVPFMVRTGHIFIACMALAMLLSRHGATTDQTHHKTLDFSTSRCFNLGVAALIAVLCGIYGIWW